MSKEKEKLLHLIYTDFIVLHGAHKWENTSQETWTPINASNGSPLLVAYGPIRTNNSYLLIYSIWNQTTL